MNKCIVHFSDIHGNFESFKCLLGEIEKINPEAVIFSGDVIGYYYEANDILEYLRLSNIKCVLGNHDAYFLGLLNGEIIESELVRKYGSSYKDIKNNISITNADYLRNLPTTLNLKICGKKIFVVHGSPTDHLNGRIYPDSNLECYFDFIKDFDLVLLGHSHHKMVKYVGKTKVINSGSAGQQRDGKGCSFSIIDLETLECQFKIIKYDVEKLSSEVKKRDPELITLLEVLTRVRP